MQRVRPHSPSSDESIKKSPNGEQPRRHDNRQSSARFCEVPIHEPVWCAADPLRIDQPVRPILANDVNITRSPGTEVGSKAERSERPEPNGCGGGKGRDRDNRNGDGALHGVV